MSFAFELARPQDDAALRRIVRESPVPGAVTVAYEREPSYFDGCACHGPFAQVLVAREEAGGAIAGLSVRAVRDLWVGGAAEPVGYLGQLRVAVPYRGRWLLSGGFRFLRELHADGRTPVYLTTLVEGNAEARALLVERPRRGFPRYRRLGTLASLAIPSGGGRRAPDGLSVAAAGEADVAEVLGFLSSEGRRRDLFPVLGLDDLRGAGAYPGLSPPDVFLVRGGGVLLGVAGLWDPSAVRQVVVRGYSGGMALARPFLDLALSWRGAGRLPRPGERLRLAFAAFPCVASGDERVFSALLSALRAAAARRGLSWLALGLVEGHPLHPLARRAVATSYRSGLYTVSWDDDDAFRHRLRAPLHVELPAL